MLYNDVTRRNFLKKIGQVTLASTVGTVLGSFLTSCATFDPNKDWSKVSPSEFNSKEFDRWFIGTKLYNPWNPNVRSPHTKESRYAHTFKQAFPRGYTPGISYKVPSGEIMVAAAPGEVNRKGILRTGRAGGYYVEVGHPKRLYYDPQRQHFSWGTYRTFYAHLSSTSVDTGQIVKRGEKIGTVTIHNEKAKIILKENSFDADPDYFGHNHSFMQYASDASVPDDEESMSTKYVDEKFKNQLEALSEFDSHRRDYLKNFLADKWHKKRGFQACTWSTPEKFKYLDTLYQLQPEQFQNLSEEHYNSIKNKFYSNQTVILTLPFVKGGMNNQ